MAGLQIGRHGANTHPDHPAIIRCAMNVISAIVGIMTVARGLGVKQSDGDRRSNGSMWQVRSPVFSRRREIGKSLIALIVSVLVGDVGGDAGSGFSG